jgi:hypothetical protein
MEYDVRRDVLKAKGEKTGGSEPDKRVLPGGELVSAFINHELRTAVARMRLG